MSSSKSKLLNKSNNNLYQKYNLRDKTKLKKCSQPEPPLNEDSDDSKYTDDDKSEDIEDESTESDDSEDDVSSQECEEKQTKDKNKYNFNNTQFLKTLLDIFPSKYMNEKVKTITKEETENIKSSKKSIKNKKETKNPISPNKYSKHTNHSVKQKTIECENDNNEDSNDDTEDDGEENSSNSSSVSNKNENNPKCNKNEKQSKNYFVLNIGNATEEDNYDDNYESEPTDDDDEYECNSEDEQTFMKEKYEKVIEPQNNVPTKKESESSKKTNSDDTIELTDNSIETQNIETEYVELLELKKQFTEKLSKNPKNKIIQHALDDCKVHISKLIKNARNQNAKYYHKLIYDDNKTPSEMDYFKKKLSNEEQLRIMNELKEINKHINIEKPYRLSILQSKMNPKYKAIAIQKLNMLRSMEPGDPEYYKNKLWVDTFMKIPFNIYKNMSVKMSDGIEVCNHFMKNAKNVLDKCVYGLNDAKMQIMQMMGQWITNPTALGTAIAIHGPPGSGKTSLVKDGISKILGREFSFIALGGSGDSSFLEGHSYTYEGSTWGKIVSILIESKCMNPIIYFDELDKISDTPRGQEIIGVLTHLTDTTQNDHFRDKYFSEIDFDLSKCLFIFSYNDENLINPILKDRMYRIQTKGYDSKEKVIIARDYLLPKIREQVNFNDTDIIIPDDTILYIAGNVALTKNESGVRNLKRCLEIIYTKLNLFRLINSDDIIFSKEIKNLNVSFPFTVTRKEVDIIIKNEESQNQSLLSMYV
jgi:ATP-dependent Lon protease